VPIKKDWFRPVPRTVQRGCVLFKILGKELMCPSIIVRRVKKETLSNNLFEINHW
jgi:hypothetical protein